MHTWLICRASESLAKYQSITDTLMSADHLSQCSDEMLLATWENHTMFARPGHRFLSVLGLVSIVIGFAAGPARGHHCLLPGGAESSYPIRDRTRRLFRRIDRQHRSRHRNKHR